MKPKNKFQKRILQLSQELPDLNADQLYYLQEKLFHHRGTLLKSGKMSCLDCGHQWQNKDTDMTVKIIGTDCPNCGRVLKVVQTRTKNFNQATYFQVIETYKGYQLIRLFEARKIFKAGEPAVFWMQKVYENWYDSDGQSTTVGMYQTSKWSDSWGGGYEIRGNKTSSDYGIRLDKKYIYPKIKFIPILKRNGLKRLPKDINPGHLFYALLNKKTIAETLLKAKQYNLLTAYLNRPDTVEELWPSIKICLRNNYHIAEPIEWMDYVRFLQQYRKDIRNAKFVCPQNLILEHNKYVEKERRRRQKEEVEERAKRMAKLNEPYIKNKGQFIGLEFSNDTFNVRFLNSVQEVKDEGDTLHHCVFSRAYYKEPTLLFSVTKDGEKYATAEVSIKTWRVLQVRGLWNKVCPQSKPIIKLITENFKLIQDRMKPKRKPRKKKQQLAMAS